MPRQFGGLGSVWYKPKKKRPEFTKTKQSRSKNGQELQKNIPRTR